MRIADVFIGYVGQAGRDRAEAAVHIRAVVGVADRRVELRQVVALLADRGRGAFDKAHDLGGRDLH
jgi:hypothetical protein